MTDTSTAGLPAYPGSSIEDAHGIAPTASRRPARSVDIAVTVVELVLATVAGAFASFASLFLLMASDACGSDGSGCRGGLIAGGVGLGVASPWVIMAIAVAVSIVLMIKRRLAFWVPWVAVVAWAGCALGALALISAGTHT